MTALPSFREALKTWSYIGCVNFGGPAGQIALMHKLLVEEKKWISDARYFHALNYCMLLPGPEAQQLATYVGWLMHGVKGGLAAGLLFILPGALVMMALSILYVNYADLAFVSAIFYGVKAAVLAIVIEAILRIGKRAFTGPAMIWIAAAAFIALFFFAVPFPLVVLAAAIAGIVGANYAPDQFQSKGHAAHGGTAGVSYAVDEAFARGEMSHTQATGSRTVRTILLWLAIWLAPVLAIALALGQASVFTKLATFFSTMSVVTFGGAYAVLAYVAQEAVATYNWLTAPEMLDGLALAETTPGPLILVLQHVGFLAGYRTGGMLQGVAGAAITLWVTFAPSFLWIFAGAPYAERARENRIASAALAAITAAVVGVILDLAIWFALHVIFAKVERQNWGPLHLEVPDITTLDPIALTIAAGALVALVRFKMPVVWLLVACAGIGLAVRASL
ncbi:MAG: chromate efflux transporter [Alphaproteobacteria bacterium]|nr:chromate efflux transporter [Alphaproteobacteria bacterium]